MQNKGLIKFITILLTIVCIYQLSFTFISSHVESKAKEHAKTEYAKLVAKRDRDLKEKGFSDLTKIEESQLEFHYLDSLENENVFLGFTYGFAKNNAIKRGLDLEGGINVILEVSVKDVLYGLSNQSQDPTFNKALEEAKKNIKGNQTYLDAFFDAFDLLAKDSGAKYASPDIFLTKDLENDIKSGMSNNEVKPVIRKKVDDAVASAFDILRKRIDKFGVAQPNIQRLGNTGRILIELPGAKDEDRIKKLLQSTAQLEFWETHKAEEVAGYLNQVNDYLKSTEKSEVADNASATIDSLLLTAKDSEINKGTNPLYDKFLMGGGGNVLGYFAIKDTAAVNGYLNRDAIKNMRPAHLRYTKFTWGKPTSLQINEQGQKVNAIELYALKADRGNQPAMSGSAVVSAEAVFDQFGRPSVSMQMSGQGSKAWEELTGKVHTQQNAIAIVLDNIVYSAPGVTSGPISGGRSEISGSFTVEETTDLANILRAGKLPASADIVQSAVVGPSLGQQAINNGMMSFGAGFLLVVAWMAMHYGKAGWFANISLVFNVLFLIGILASLGAVLTLSGIAGIVLTLAMAIDANVILYERAKEELQKGSTTEEAVNYSFTWKGAMSAIIDVNVTTVITALILLMFGTGPTKGFATTLLIGVGTSAFTSIFITRILLDRSIRKGEELTFDTSITRNWFKNMNFKFYNKRKYAYGFAIIFSLVSIYSLFFGGGLNQGVDFMGGRTFQVRFEQPVKANEIADLLTKDFGTNVEAKTHGSADKLKITTKYKVEVEGEGVDREVNEKLYNSLKSYYSNDISYSEFVENHDGKELGILESTKVGPTIAEDIKTDAYWAVIGSLFAVFLYLLLSFKKWQFSFASVVGVAHDVIFILGIYSLCWRFMPFSMEVDQAFIAAILTVVGYSMNDTVIIFDRIREYMAMGSGLSKEKVVDEALNSTLSRTFTTSFTTLLVLIIIMIFGGESLRGFIFAILLGVVFGVYSSLFIAGPIMADLTPEKDFTDPKVEEPEVAEVITTNEY